VAAHYIAVERRPSSVFEGVPVNPLVLIVALHVVSGGTVSGASGPMGGACASCRLAGGDTVPVVASAPEGDSAPDMAALGIMGALSDHGAPEMALPLPLPVDPPMPSDSLLGQSGKLRARFLSTTRHSMALPILRHFFGDSAAERPGVYALHDSVVGARSFALITMLPFGIKSRGRVGDYRVGWWPAERRRARSSAYVNPDGFIRVTPDNVDTPVSEHFRLRDFLTHDQEEVWPKYLVLREVLIDKLELIIDDLAAHGHPNAHVVVMSGFRTPEYNALGVGHGGRARDSRHQFGDAADIYVDNDGDGIMDDLDGDGRITTRDVRVLLASVDRVEAAHPELVGGAGVYGGTRAHGPFLHVDVRGEAVRWTVGATRRYPTHTSKRANK
jgi:hypothetical protein